MEKTKYRVYINCNMCYTYVTTTRNCEDMIFQIREMHERNTLNYATFKISRQISDGKEITVYSSKTDRKSNNWESELYN